MAIRPRTLRPLLVRRATAQTVRLEVWDGSAPIAPASGTFTLYDDSDTVRSTSSVTVTSSIATASILAAEIPATLSYSSSWRAQWSLVISGTTEVFDQPAALVRNVFRAPIVPGDLVTRHPEFGPARELDPGQEAAGAEIGDWIDEAEAAIEVELCRSGRRAEMVIDAWQLREAALFKTLEIAFRWASTFVESGSHLIEQADKYASLFTGEMGRVQFRYDPGQTGKPSESVEVPAISAYYLSGNARHP